MFNQVSLQDKLLFTQQLTTIIKSGTPLVEGLEKIEVRIASKKLKAIIQNLINEIHQGHSFASSIKKYPKVFDQFYINLVEVGEETGNLSENLDYLTEKLNKKYDLQQEVSTQAFSNLLVLGLIMSLITILYTFIK